MLTIRYENDKSVIKTLYESLGIDGAEKGVNIVLREQEGLTQIGADTGLFRLIMLQDSSETTAIIDKIAFLNSVSEGDKNFFVRAVLYKLQKGAPILLRIPGEHRELEIFGFRQYADYAEALSTDIELHSECKCK